MTRDIIPSQPHRDLRRRTFAPVLSLPFVLVVATILFVGLWVALTLSLVFALIACAALVAIGLPICVLLAKRSWRRRLPPGQP
jgi:ABC-type proline/glycine betaine transport system permease subunit